MRLVYESPNLDQIVNEALGFERTTASAHHLSLVKLADDEPKSLLTCGKCGTKMRVGRERLAMAVDHVKKLGGEILVLPKGIEVRESPKPFEWRSRRRSKRLLSRRRSERSTG